MRLWAAGSVAVGVGGPEEVKRGDSEDEESWDLEEWEDGFLVTEGEQDLTRFSE